VPSWGTPGGNTLQPRHRSRAPRRCWLALGGILTCAGVLAADRPEVFAQLGHSNVVHALSFSPNGHTLASAGEDGATNLWDLGTQRELRTLKLDANGINCAAFSPDGLTLAAGSHDGAVILWDVTTGRALRVLRGHSGAVHSVAFSPDGRTIASGGADHTIKLWNSSTGTEVRALLAHRDAVTAVAFSPDGHTLASGSVDKTIKLWDAASGHELRTLSGHTDRLSSLAFCPAGKMLASASWDHTVKLWDPASGHELRTLRGHASEVWSVACAPDGRTIASGGYDHNIKLWEAQSGHELHTMAGDPRWVEAVAFSPDGRLLASGGADHSVKLWDATSGEKLHTLQGHADFVKSVAFSRNGHLLVSGSADHTLRLWRIADGRELRTIAAHESWVAAAVFTPDGHQVASRSGDQTIKLWDIVTGRMLHSLRVGNALGGSSSVAISPDGRALAAGGPNNSITLWSVTDGAQLRTFSGHSAAVESVAFSADGLTLASGDEHATIKLWNVASGRELHTLTGHSSWVDALAFSPDGRMLASGSGDKTIRLWDVASGRELQTLHGHSAPVTAVAFAPTDKVLAASDELADIKLWSVTSGQELRTLRGHTDLVESVAFSPDGRVLASASSDSTIRLWDVTSGAERLRLIAFNDGSFLQLTPQGYYDFQGDTAEEYLNVRVGGEVSGISAYREKFYRPDIVQLALSGQKLPATLATLASVQPAPDVTLIGVPAAVDTETLDLHVGITDRGGGIGNVRTFVNGSAVSEIKGRALEVVAAAGVPSRTIRLRLVPGSNDIQVIAFNADGSVHSNPAHTTVIARYSPTQKPQLYALVVGIQDFQNTSLDLRYSVADATAIAQLLQKKSAPLFDKVNIEQLTTQKATTKDALLSAFARYRTIAPDDVFLFYVASHGTVEGADPGKREYFLIPSNVNAITDEAIRRDALSEGELRQLIASIPATRKLLLLDTCHAGAMGDAMMVTTRGMEELAAVRVLSGAVGSTVLSASTSDQEALEGEDGHGLFTWVLLQGLGGDADFRKHGYINTFDLADYVDDEVPKIAEQHFKRKQVPNLHNAGQSFQIVSSR
jgi:WD40 repeat protein